MGDDDTKCTERTRSRGGVARRWCLAVAVMMTAVLSAAVSTPLPASAATEIDWYAATPGFIRTDLQTTTVATNPDGDRLYAVVGDGPERRLLLIDFADYTVLKEVPIQEDDVWDIAVSNDGRTVFILDSSGIFIFDAATLAETGYVEAFGGPDRIATAPDDNDVVALSDAGRLFRDGNEIDLTGTVLEDATAFGFGATADEVFAVGLGGAPIRASLAGSTVTLVGEGANGLVDRSATTEYVDGQVHYWDRELMTAVDPATLQIVASTSVFATATVVHNSNDRQVYSVEGEFFSVAEYDTSVQVGPTFTLSNDAPVEPLLALDDGILLALEYTATGSGYLVELDTTILASGFGDYHAVQPDRILDTRFGLGVDAPGRVGPGETIEFQVAGLAGVPSTGVLAVTMNATVTEPTGSGFVKIWPTGQDRPEVSNVNYTSGQTVANGVTVTLGPDGKLQMYNHLESATHVLFDVTGYYTRAAGSPGARYVSGGRRVLDTRNATQGRFGKLGPGEFLDLYVPSHGDGIFPISGTVAAVLNVTVANASEFSFISAFPRDAVGTGTSTINFYPGDLRSNMTVVSVSSDDHVRLRNHVGTVDVIVDVIGHYVLPSPFDGGVNQVGRYYPVVPFRRLDTRAASPFGGNGSLTPGSALILPSASGWTDIINLTVTEPTRDGYVSVIGWDGSPLPGPPGTSSVNFVRNQTVPNGAYATSTVDFAIVNPIGNTHVVVDVFGFLTPERLESIDVVFSPQAARQRELVGAGSGWDARRLPG